MKRFISVLTPVYNEEKALPHFVSEIQKTLLNQPAYQFEVLFIDDASTDGSWDFIQSVCHEDHRFRAVRLSRNQGSHIALSAGFQLCQGDAAVILAADLQDPPEMVLEFLKKWREGAAIVWGKRAQRKEVFWRVLTSRLFSSLIKKYAMPKNSKFTTGSFLLADRQVIECYKKFGEQNRITFALIAFTGFEQAVVSYRQQKRIAGHSHWSFGRMVKTMYDALMAYSYLPIRLISIAGVAAFLFAIGLSAYLLYVLYTGNPLPGWTSQLLVLNFFFGIQFLIMGIVGEYLYRIYSEVLRRPLYFISDRAGRWHHEPRTSKN